MYNYIEVINVGKTSASKTKYTLAIEKDLKEKLEQEAKEQIRSLNNLIEIILKEYISNK